MNCKYCKVEMAVGEAIDPKRIENGLGGPIVHFAWEELEMIPVWKCPDCGHSDYIRWTQEEIDAAKERAAELIRSNEWE